MRFANSSLVTWPFFVAGRFLRGFVAVIDLLLEPCFMPHRQAVIVRSGSFPSPVVGDAFIVHEYQVNLVGKRRRFSAILPVTISRDATVAPPAHAAWIFVILLPKALEDCHRRLQ